MHTSTPRKWIRRAWLAPALLIVFGGASQAQAAPKDKPAGIDYRTHEPDARLVDKAQAEAKQDGTARVLVTMSTKFTPMGELSAKGRLDQRYVLNQFTQQWGAPGDIATPRDVDGDGGADLVVWRPSGATWWTLKRTPGGNVTSVTQWGTSGDIPVGPTPTQLK
jgi:hypothetical protein